MGVKTWVGMTLFVIATLLVVAIRFGRDEGNSGELRRELPIDSAESDAIVHSEPESDGRPARSVLEGERSGEPTTPNSTLALDDVGARIGPADSRSASLSGIVVDSRNQPVSGAEVMARPLRKSLSERPESSSRVRTDAEGRFVFHDAELAGLARVSLQARHDRHQDLGVEVQGGALGLVLRMVGLARLRGRFVVGPESSLTGLEITLVPETGRNPIQGGLDDDGRFDFCLPAGRYDLSLSDGATRDDVLVERSGLLLTAEETLDLGEIEVPTTRREIRINLVDEEGVTLRAVSPSFEVFDPIDGKPLGAAVRPAGEEGWRLYARSLPFDLAVRLDGFQVARQRVSETEATIVLHRGLSLRVQVSGLDRLVLDPRLETTFKVEYRSGSEASHSVVVDPRQGEVLLKFAAPGKLTLDLFAYVAGRLGTTHVRETCSIAGPQTLEVDGASSRAIVHLSADVASFAAFIEELKSSASR